MKTYERKFDNDSRVTYIPKEPGIYLINVQFANEHVPGSPFTVKALDNTCNLDKDEVEKMEEVEQEVGQEELKIPKISPSLVTSSTQVKSAAQVALAGRVVK